MGSFGPLREDDETARQQLAARLREARKCLGLNQEDVAAYLKIGRTALTRIESGQRRVEAIELARLDYEMFGEVIWDRLGHCGMQFERVMDEAWVKRTRALAANLLRREELPVQSAARHWASGTWR